MIERLLIAAGILVVNGAVLVLVLRLLTMVVIRRVPRGDETVAAVPAPVEEPVAAPAVEQPEPELVAAAAAASEAPVFARPRSGRRNSNGHLYRIHHHRMLLGVPVLAAIFASGAWLGDWVGGGSSADAATVTVHLKGKVIRVAGKPVAVRVPGQTVKVKGRIVTVPGTTVHLPPKTQIEMQTVTDTRVVRRTSTQTTTLTTTISLPTTLTDTTTETTTVTETATVTDTTSSSATT